jgi:hypothetical protein
MARGKFGELTGDERTRLYCTFMIIYNNNNNNNINGNVICNFLSIVSKSKEKTHNRNADHPVPYTVQSRCVFSLNKLA